MLNLLHAAPEEEPKFEAPNKVWELLFEQTQGDNPAAVLQALSQLADVCYDSLDDRKEAHAMGCHGVVLSVMRKWWKNLDIQAEGCRCFQNMMHECYDAKYSFSRICGMDVIISIMNRFPTSVIIHRSACGALSNFFNSSEDTIKKEIHRFVHDLDGISLVMTAMKQFPDDATVQKWACGFLVNFIQAEDKEPIRRSGAVTAVAAAIDMHPKDKEIQTWGAEFMKCIFT
jgi:hypothetical protein